MFFFIRQGDCLNQSVKMNKKYNTKQVENMKNCDITQKMLTSTF